MTIQETSTIGEFVAQDYRTAAIFSKYGIDFCCKGQKSIEEVCSENDINETNLLNDLNAVLATKKEAETDFNLLSLDLLIDYIEKKHHLFIKEKTPEILQFLDKLCGSHGNNHPELFEINQLFKDSAEELFPHMKKEELILFPFIKDKRNEKSWFH
jgi:regulator of cell morphogenesis and NO signaling